MVQQKRGLVFEVRIFLTRYWFLVGLLVVTTATLTDASGTLASLGVWCRLHRGPDLVIVAIFFFSGVALDIGQVRAGLVDMRPFLGALVVIFVAAPLLGWLLSSIPMDPGIRIGLLLVAVMPTTLSSGVVMTGAAGGNMASALMITLCANSLAIFTVPLALNWLLGTGSGLAAVIPRQALMIKMAELVLLPLVIGLWARRRLAPWMGRKGLNPNVINGSLVLAMVWIGVSSSRSSILDGLPKLVPIVLLIVSFHTILLGVGILMCRLLKLSRGRREAVIFMGSQKTLPLSVLIQVVLFPQYGDALVFCVCHHVVHLIMDSYLVGKLGKGA